jgi:hypothetical protein
MEIMAKPKAAIPIYDQSRNFAFERRFQVITQKGDTDLILDALQLAQAGCLSESGYSRNVRRAFMPYGHLGKVAKGFWADQRSYPFWTIELVGA